MLLGVRLAAAQAVLFVREQDDADRAGWLEAELRDRLQGLHHRDDTGTVVVRALADVPRIDVAADHDEFVGLLAAAQLADHVLGRDLPGQLAR